MQTKRVGRRKHGKEFKAEVVQACRQAGESVAAIALRSGLNANVVYRWLREEALPTHKNHLIAELLPHRWQALRA